MDKFVSNIVSSAVGSDDKDNKNETPGNVKGFAGALSNAQGLLSLLNSDDNVKKTADDASQRAGNSGDADLFKTVLGSLSQKKDKVADNNQDLDEQSILKNFKKFVQNENADDEKADSNKLGSAAAMQAVKLFTSSSSKDSSSLGQAALLSLAMSEASKLFDEKSSQGKVSSDTSKQSVVEKAGETAMRMYLKSQADQNQGLAGLAAKFL